MSTHDDADKAGRRTSARADQARGLDPTLGARGGISFIEVMHASDCPGRYTNGEGCTCTPRIRMHNDTQHFLRCEAVNRAARRKAAREAERAMRKAARRAAR